MELVLPITTGFSTAGHILICERQVFWQMLLKLGESVGKNSWRSLSKCLQLRAGAKKTESVDDAYVQSSRDNQERIKIVGPALRVGLEVGS